MKKKFLLMMMLSLLFTAMGTSVLNAQNGNVSVAKVGNTEYATIDEAIANWTNGTTLTLLSDVTLSDVVTIKSTEHHILALGSYTMTAANGKNAFVIQACGTGSSERSTITINADATNPGGINAGNKCVIYYKYADGGISTEDRPIIKINGGVFTGATSSSSTAGIYTIGTAARKCATLNIAGGTFNCSIYGSGKSKLIVSGGLFNYSVGSQGDSTCYRLISGGTFKSFGFMTADSNNTKFWIGTSMGISNVGVSVDDNGYIVVGGPVITEAGETFEASSANYSGASSYLQYSSAKDNGLYYTSVEEAFADNNKTTGSVTVYVEELDMTGISYKGTIVVPEGHYITITNAPATLVVKDAEDNVLQPNANGSYSTIVPQGNDFTGYTGTYSIWGEVWGNAYESFVIKVLDANGIVMGTTSLNNIGGIINGSVNVTWHITLPGITDEDQYWIQEWTTDPSIDDMPAKVELWVDGVKVSGGNVVLNGPDNTNMIYAAVTDAEGNILSYHTSITAAVAAITNTRSNPQGYIALLRNTDEAITLPAGIVLNTNGFNADNIVIPVASVNGTSYATLADALSAASAMAGDVTVEIYEKVTLNQSLSGSYSSIKFVGKDTDAEIYLDVQGYITATGKKVAFEDLTLSKSEGGSIYDAGFMNVAFGVYDVTEVTYTNCTFANGAYASSGNVTYTGCTFKRSHDKYGLWAYGNVDVTVNGCTFADYRGIKMYAEGAAKTVDLTVKNTDFSAVTDKPAIVLTYGESVTLENNTYSETGTFELDLDGAPNGTPINYTDDNDEKLTCKNDNGDCGVLCDGKIYTTVAQAAEVAISGSTVTLLHNSTETVVLPMGVTLNKNGYEAAGVTVTQPVAQVGETKYGTLQAALQAAAQTEELTTIQLLAGTHTFGNVKFPATLKNVTIVGADNKATIIKDSKLYSADGNAVTYKGITFDGIVFDNSSILFTGARNGEVVYEDWTIKNCDFRNLQSSDGIAAIHFNLAADETIKNFTFEKNTITDVTSPSNSASGLRLNYVTGNVVIKDNETNNVAFNAVQIINSVVDNFTFEGNILRSNSSSLANLYNVTGENIVITKNQFLANENQKSVSNIAYADVSGNYWGGGAPKNLPEGVVCSSYYTTVESDGTLGGLVELPQGNQPIAYVKEVDGYVRVWGETWGNAKESYALELYSGETKIATTELNNVGGIINGSVNVTWNFFYPESTDEYWTTTWHENPQADKQPDKVVLVIDGVAVNEGPVYMSGADGINPVVWADLGGVISGGTWGGIDWTLVDGTLTITPTTGTPTTDNSGKWSYEVGQWPEAVIYDNNGVGVDIGLWPYDRTKVKTLVIEEGVTSIGSFTAQGFTNLTGEVEIPYTVKYIGQEAFLRSTMTTLTFAPVPEGKTGEELCIAQGALKNLVIEEITFPEDRPVHLHAWMFANSNNLKHVTFPATVVGIGGTVHVDYSHNPNATHGGGSNSCGLLSKCPALETITFGSQEVRDMYYNPYYEREDAPIVVNVGLKSYKDFRAGINAAKDGETVLLLGNVTLEDTWTIPAGMNLTLDLNGKTISQEKACTASYEMINNKGNLTITGEGKLSFEDTSAGDPTFGWGSYTVRNEGTLVVENGTIEHLGEQSFATHMICAIFQYSGSSTINDGTISTPTYRSVRLWKGDMTINGGTFDGQLWVQCVDNSAKLTINGGKFSPNGGDGSSVFVGNVTNAGVHHTAEFTVTGGTFETKIGCNDAENLTGGLISGGNFTAAAVANTSEALLAPGFVFSDEANAEGYYTVEDDPKTEYISTIEGLKAFRDAVNAGNTYQGVTVYLTEDIDLAPTRSESNWTPIGTNKNPFKGTFDGQDHTISNLTITGYNSNQGFFGMTTDGEIKNVIFENAKVSGRLNVGVVAGTPYTSKYTNITVTGHVEVNGMSYVGGVGGKNAYANWTDITVNVDEDSYVKATSTENGTAYRSYVGGVIGFNGEGGHTFKNIKSNINVIGDVCDIGGIFGIAHYGNKFENIEHSGTVTNTNSNAEEVAETGLIAGVWHNQAGTSVTFTDTSSDGTISVPNVTGVTFPNDGLIGAAYTTSNETSSTSGSLTINGEQVYPYVAKIGEVGYNTLAKAITAAQSDDVVTLLWVEGDAPIAMNASLYGKNVTITGTATVDWSEGWLFVGRGGAGDATLIFDGAILTSNEKSLANGSYGIHVSAKEVNEVNKNYGKVIFKNSDVQLSYLANRNNVEVDGGNLYVHFGFWVGGRPSKETPDGLDGTATMDIKNGAVVVVNNHNGMGLGYESNGIMNIDATSTFETTQDFLITAKGTMNVNGGNVKVDDKLTNKGAVNIKDATVKLAKLDNDNLMFISGTNTLQVEDASGSSFTLRARDGVVFNNSYVKGTANETMRLLGSATFNGGFECAYLQGKSADESNPDNNGVGGTITIEEGTTVHATYGVEFSNNYVLNGGTIELSGGNANGGIWGCVFQDGEYTINSNVIVNGGGKTAPIYFTDATAVVNGNIAHSNSGGEVIYLKNSEVTFAETSTVSSTAGVHVNDGATLTNKGNIAGNVTVKATLNSENNITGKITKVDDATIILTGGTYTQDVNEWCHEYYDAIPNGNGTWTVEQVMYALVRDLQEGWSWFSSFINIDGEAGLTKIKDALGENGVQVKDAYSGSFIQYTSASGWKGLLNEASSKAVYSIKTINDGDDIPEISVKDFTIKGAKVDPSLLENTVYINKGWNYIAYPLDQVAGLDVLSFTPAEGDVIKSKESSSMYWGGGWISNIDMTPGEGYMYKSNDNATKSFNFAYPTRSAVDASISNNVTNDYYWSVNAHKYPSNMTIVAMLNIDNELVKDSYEIAAFANGECRGRAQSVYVESLDTYVLVLTVHGEDVENITFKYYDVNSGAEYELSNIMVYSNDAIVGSVDEPYMFNLDILNVDEASINEVNVYPNPTTTNAEIDLNATCDKVEVFNALGVKVAEYSNVDSIDALETAGVYVIRVTIDGNARNCRLIVK